MSKQISYRRRPQKQMVLSIPEQPTLYKTYGPYVVLVPINSAFLLNLTFNSRHEKERTQKYFGSHLEFKSLITWSHVNQSDIFRQSNFSTRLSCTHAQFCSRRMSQSQIDFLTAIYSKTVRITHSKKFRINS